MPNTSPRIKPPDPLKKKVFVAGTGVISAIGSSLAETMKSFQQETSGVGRLSLIESVHQNSIPVGEVKIPNAQLAEQAGVDATLSRTALLGIHAARQAMDNSKIAAWKKWRTGLISATTVGGMDKTEKFFFEVSSGSNGRLRDVANHACGSITELMADNLNIHDFVSTINSACSSSVNSVIFGSRMIASGMLDIVVVGGTDALTKFTLNGFNSLMILDGSPCRPFDATRSGLNLGEGAGYLVLASEQVLKEENIEPDCLVNGFANTSDAFHQTASSPEGRGSFGAMQDALEMSGLRSDEIDYVNLHGTGTVNNDLSEGTAVKRLFGENIPKLSSTKAFTGHTLGASGGIESVFSVLSLRHQCVFPNLRFENAMPELNIVPQKNFDAGLSIKHVMNNAFGFGGNCSSVIFSRA